MAANLVREKEVVDMAQITLSWWAPLVATLATVGCLYVVASLGAGQWLSFDDACEYYHI